MIKIPKISKQLPASKAKDFAFLKEEGMRYIQKLAAETWTDYNAHDPGITILEQLAYAINDLAHRTSFDIKDLLAEEEDGQGKQDHFFTPREILTTNPVSINDFRKIIIDVDGIKNAWLEPRIEKEFYSDGPVFYKEPISGTMRYLEDEEEVDPDSKVKLLGLYDILLEFENNDQLGDLNHNRIKNLLIINDQKSELHGLKLEVAASYPYWDDPEIDHPSLLNIQKNLLDVEINFIKKAERFIIKFAPSAGSKSTFEVYDAVSRLQRTDLSKELNVRFEEILTLMSENYLTKLKLINDIVSRVNQRIHQHRNLCEDFIQIRSLKVKEIALCMKINLDHFAVPDHVLASIFHQINEFLSPGVTFRSLQELLSRQIPVDDIFEGPALNDGFITEDELAVNDRRHIIYTSDLINIISDVEGVSFVSEIEIAKRENGEFIDQIEGDQWHLELDDEGQNNDYYIPRLNMGRSNVKFYKDGIPLSTNPENVFNKLSSLETADKKEINTDLDIVLSFGSAKQVDIYPSIQSDFPSTYNISEEGVSPTATKQKKAQVKQLKGYLLVFEQLLTNYLAQLSNVNKLFSLDTTIDSTYFVNNLYDVPHIAPLLRDFIQSGDFSENPEEDNPKEFQHKWSEFTLNQDNEYITNLTNIVEDKEQEQSLFVDRRNRFLNHLMARFSEDFGEYEMIMHDIDRIVSNTKLIEDKALLLKDYPIISANRGRAFDYHSTYIDENQHQYSGLEIRMARLLGIDLENLATESTVVEKYVDQVGEHRFRIKDKTGEIILNSEEGYETEAELDHIIEMVLESATNVKNYQKRTDRRGKYYFNLIVKSGTEIIARSQEYYDKEEDQNEEINNVLEHIQKMDEKLHLIEHILLRPKIKGRDHFISIESPSEEYPLKACCPGTNDPYSFTVSILLPSWPARFRNLEFRRYVEKKVRLETPAHLFPKVCWINREQMNLLEKVLIAWKSSLNRIDFNEKQFLGDHHFDEYAREMLLNSFEGISELPKNIRPNKTTFKKQLRKLRKAYKSKGAKPIIKEELLKKIEALEKIEKLITRSDALNELIAVMSSLRNIYPEATLYDCQESEAENPVSLNSTILGTFKPLDDE